MKVLFTFFISLSISSFASTELISSETALEKLVQSDSIFSNQLLSSRDYANKNLLIESQVNVRPLISDSNQIQILSIVYKPENFQELEVYQKIVLDFYFRPPGHFNRTIGDNKLNFYKVDLTTHIERISFPTRH